MTKPKSTTSIALKVWAAIYFAAHIPLIVLTFFQILGLVFLLLIILLGGESRAFQTLDSILLPLAHLGLAAAMPVVLMSLLAWPEGSRLARLLAFCFCLPAMFYYGAGERSLYDLSPSAIGVHVAPGALTLLSLLLLTFLSRRQAS